MATQTISRRSMFSSAAAAGVALALPTAVAVAALPKKPYERMKELVEELKLVALEFDPEIIEWHIGIFPPDTEAGLRCRVCITAFHRLSDETDDTPDTVRTRTQKPVNRGRLKRDAKLEK